jgi:hypothetical protein
VSRTEGRQRLVVRGQNSGMDDKGGMNSFGIGMDDKAINTGMGG